MPGPLPYGSHHCVYIIETAANNIKEKKQYNTKDHIFVSEDLKMKKWSFDHPLFNDEKCSENKEKCEVDGDLGAFKPIVFATIK
jgi:hypothetical protein